MPCEWGNIVVRTSLGLLAPRALCVVLLLVQVLDVATAWADTGVSDERVSLPDGPGSVGGAGENLSAAGNMGAMAYQIPVQVPEGFPAAMPRLSLSYSSMSGNELVGIGWDLPIPHIERFSLRGLPRYDANDLFAADGSEELVEVEVLGDGSRVFRERFEGSFVRYTWHRVGQGKVGYWTAEFPDGTVGYFGADRTGKLTPSSCVTHPAGGVFRYMLVETVDSFGHRVRYNYVSDQASPLAAYPRVRRIEYLFTGGSEQDEGPRYQIEFDYETRSDVISNAIPGFDLRLAHRLSAIRILSHQQALRSYALHYEEATAGMSRLKLVEQFGADGARSPIAFELGYSPSLDLSCSDCARPLLLDMGKLTGGSVDLKNGRATLLDINGDALPDVVDTTAGTHRFFVNEMKKDGQQAFLPARLSGLTDTSFRLEEARVQAADVNGDGFTDLFHAGSGDVLCNEGRGDWVLNGECRGLGLPTDLTADVDEVGDSDPEGVRFFDYDGDKRIDMLGTRVGLTSIWHNRGKEDEPRVFDLNLGLGRVFDQGNLQLADLNGDGLLDLVDVSNSGEVWSRLYLGYGRWQSAPRDVNSLGGLPPGTDFQGAELQDLNGDGLDDVVLVQTEAVHFWLNRAGQFLPVETLGPQHVQGSGFPNVSQDSVTVLFADMNASGSTDIVWVDSSNGSVRVLELFAQRPNLLTRVENGIGGVQTVEYGSSARQQARDILDGEPWRYKLPQAIQVVTASERYATLTAEVVLREERRYHNGYYDGRERRYRGFEELETETPADGTQEGRRRIVDYDVGFFDVYRQGRVQRESLFSVKGGEARELRSTLYSYDDRCPLAGVPVTEPEVRFVCDTGNTVTIKEGRSESDWVTLRTTREYDGFGNVTLEADHGVVPTPLSDGSSRGCGACEAPSGTASGACGETCLGDERFVVTDYVVPGADTGGAWTLGAAYRTRTYGRPSEEDGVFSEVLQYYDGPAFEGMELGRLDKGLVTRVCERESPQAADDCEGEGWVRTSRVQYDAHGNTITELDPLYEEGMADHKRTIVYDSYGLRPQTVRIFVTADAEPYALSRTFTYHPLFYLPQTVTNWTLEGAPVSSELTQTQWLYDSFGRRTAVVLPGDSLQAPTHRYEYELSAPASRVIARTRSEQGGAFDLEEISCLDGLGRLFQSRTRLRDGVYQVSGFHAVNPRGAPVRAYQGYQGGAGCDNEVPAGVPFARHFYDGLGRPLEVTAPRLDATAEPFKVSYEYAPLVVTTFDAEDHEPLSEGYRTPSRVYYDGLGRLIRQERRLSEGGESADVRAFWDDLGRLAGYRDAGGNRRSQAYDLLGRVIEVEDVNAGRSLYRYDDASNVLEREDARGKVTRAEYDGLNRVVAQYDPSDRAATRATSRYDFAVDCDDCPHGAGRLVQTRYPLGHERGLGGDDYGYDLRGRNVHVVRTLEGHAFATRTEYDNADRVRVLEHPNAAAVKYDYDAASRVVGIEGVIRQVTYDSRGLVSQLVYENGVQAQYQYDALERLSRAQVLGGAGTALQDLYYERDRVSNVLSVRDSSVERAGRVRWDVDFQQDAWYRTVQARYADDEVVEFGFDKLDNISNMVSSFGPASAAHVGEYGYDAIKSNAVTRAGQLVLSYDEAGSLAARGDRTLVWDYQNRLQSASTADGHRADYAYGTGIDRVMEWHDGSVTYYASPDFEVRDGVAVTYVSLAGMRVARLSGTQLGSRLFDDPNGNKRVDVGDAWMTRSPSDRARRQLWGSARRLLAEAEPTPVFLHGDHQESLTLATSSEGQVRGERGFYPTGELRVERGFVDQYGFTGQRRDATTGLMHFRFREFDPTTGRWVSPDPLFAVSRASLLTLAGQSTSAYAYVGGAFSSGVDPSGLFRALRTWLRRLGRFGRRGAPTSSVPQSNRPADPQARYKPGLVSSDFVSLSSDVNDLRHPKIRELVRTPSFTEDVFVTGHGSRLGKITAAGADGKVEYLTGAQLAERLALPEGSCVYLHACSSGSSGLARDLAQSGKLRVRAPADVAAAGGAIPQSARVKVRGATGEGPWYFQASQSPSSQVRYGLQSGLHAVGFHGRPKRHYDVYEPARRSFFREFDYRP